MPACGPNPCVQAFAEMKEGLVATNLSGSVIVAGEVPVANELEKGTKASK